jgi:hypothetical protein
MQKNGPVNKIFQASNPQQQACQTGQVSFICVLYPEMLNIML